MDKPAPIRNRVTEMLGIDYPVVQAPMGWIARSQLASAVSNAGGLGIIETSSGELDVIKAEIAAMREAIREAHDAIKASPYPDQQALTKLQPYITP